MELLEEFTVVFMEELILLEEFLRKEFRVELQEKFSVRHLEKFPIEFLKEFAVELVEKFVQSHT